MGIGPVVYRDQLRLVSILQAANLCAIGHTYRLKLSSLPKR